jgi:hypothetical protein
MAFLAKIEVGGKSYEVLSVNFSVGQMVDEKGQPVSNVHAGNIFVQVETTPDTILTAWMANAFEKKDGNITFYKRDAESKMRTVSWVNGYCVGYSESFNQMDTKPMVISINISAEKVTIQDVEIDNRWPEH